VIAGIVILAGVLLLNVVTHGSRQIQVSAVARVPVDQQGAAARLSEAIRFQTISNFLNPEQDADALRGLQAHIGKSFSAFHAAARRETVAGYSLLYTWEGTDPKAPPIALLAHQDVVPVAPGTEKDWQQPPYDGVISDGFIWGRGSWDDKGNLYSILEAAEAMAKQGFRPKRTIYFAFGHDEEVAGTRGAKAIAALLASRGVRLDFVLDEGLLIAEGLIKGLDKPAALIGVAEKGYATLVLTAHATPSHSSMPPRDTAIGMMSAALARLEDHRLPMQIRGTVSEMFDTLAPETSGFNRVVLSNLWLFKPLLLREFEKSGPTEATVRTTTTALTIFNAGDKDNVLPGNAEATVNFRLIPGERDRPCSLDRQQRSDFRRTVSRQHRSAAGDGHRKPILPHAQPNHPGNFSRRHRCARPDGGRDRLASLCGDCRQHFPVLAGARKLGRSEAISRHQRASQHRRLWRHDQVLSAADREYGGITTQTSFRGDAKHRTRNLEIPGSLVSLAPRNDSASHPRPRQAMNGASGAQRVDQQTRYRHLTDAAGHRRDRARYIQSLGKGDIADQTGLAVNAGQAIYPDIDHRGARLDPVAAHHFRFADGGVNQIGAGA
jgi:carboxypeptidase PM20D1